MKAITIRFDDDTYNKLKEIAEQEQRSFNNIVLYCCNKALKTTKRKEK